jgi:hypothetical protein
MSIFRTWKSQCRCPASRRRSVFLPRKTESFEGVLVTDGAKSTGSIAYNEASRRERQRFTIAHELGHFVLPFHGPGAQCAKADLGVLKSTDPNREKEAEANRFAASLLMPRKRFQQDIRRLGAPETDHIIKLAGRYEVSKEAAARRYTDLSGHACAVIFSHDGKLRTFSKSTLFPFLEIGRDQPLPADSISARPRTQPGRISDWAETAPETWVASSPRLKGKVICEQFLEQANGYRLTMLTLDDIGDDDETDEEAELGKRWTVGFRR